MDGGFVKKNKIRKYDLNVFCRFMLCRHVSSCYLGIIVLAFFVFFKNLIFYAGDVNSISIGTGTNIQDNSLVHVAKSNLSGKVLPTLIGDNVTVG